MIVWIWNANGWPWQQMATEIQYWCWYSFADIMTICTQGVCGAWLHSMLFRILSVHYSLIDWIAVRWNVFRCFRCWFWIRLCECKCKIVSIHSANMIMENKCMTKHCAFWIGRRFARLQNAIIGSSQSRCTFTQTVIELLLFYSLELNVKRTSLASVAIITCLLYTRRNSHSFIK